MPKDRDGSPIVRFRAMFRGSRPQLESWIDEGAGWFKVFPAEPIVSDLVQRAGVFRSLYSDNTVGVRNMISSFCLVVFFFALNNHPSSGISPRPGIASLLSVSTSR